MLRHFGIDRARLTENPAMAECARTSSLPSAMPSTTANLTTFDGCLAFEAIQTHVPDYVFALYWQSVGQFNPTEREAYMASLLANVAMFEQRPIAPNTVTLQENGSCFTLYYMDDVVVCGCSQPDCQDGVTQLFSSAATSQSPSPIRCAWFDTQSRYASVEMTNAEAKHALISRQTAISDQSTSPAPAVNVCVRDVENSAETCQNHSMVAASDSDIADTPPPLVSTPAASPITSDELLVHAPMSEPTSSLSPWSPVAQSLYNDPESPVSISFEVGDRVMLRPIENQSPTAALLSQNDGPYVITEAVGGACYRVLNDRDCRSMVVHKSRIQCRFPTHASENKDNTDRSAPTDWLNLTNKDVAACQTSDSAVALWLNGAATHSFVPIDPDRGERPPTLSPIESFLAVSGRKRVKITTSLGDDIAAESPRKRARVNQSCVLGTCE